MVTDPQQSQSHLFTVRLWREELGGNQTELRGRVQHVISGETLAFREWVVLLSFLEAHMGLPSKLPTNETSSSISDEGEKHG
jgi:hypothetical protein